MEIGIVGLGKMGANMARRLIRGGHRVVGFDLDREAVRRLRDEGADGASGLEELTAALEPPRAVWLMVPAGAAVDSTLDDLVPHLQHGDVVVDGGNSFYKDTVRRAGQLRERGIRFVDAGTSGGVWGLEEGYSLMVGGEEEAVERVRPVLEALAPAPDRGWGHVGPPGSGHFVKMVHNGIEYGLMEAYAEGFAILGGKEEFELDLHQVAEIWRFGSVVRSWLLDLAARALEKDQSLSDIAPWVEDSGEGRWTVFESIDLNTPAPVITLSLIRRLASRDEEGYSHRLLAAMRREFGGHEVKKEDS